MIIRRLALLLPLLLLTACSNSDDPVEVVPAGPRPDAVTDLGVISGASGSLTLGWTSPDLPADIEGTISYDLRYCKLGREDDPLDTWISVAAPSADAESGVARQHQVTGLSTINTNLFRLRSRVGSGPWSVPSNPVVANASVDHDQTPPAAVGELLQWAGTGQSVTVAWAAAGDDSIYGAAAAYDLRWHETATDWEAMTPATGPVEPTQKPGWLGTTIEGVPDEAEIAVRIRARDEVDNLSPVSELFSMTADTMRTWYINVEGTGDTRTLEEAVQAAGRGDLILVAPGRYTWSDQGTGDPQYGMIWVPLNHVGFTIRGEAGPYETILDAEHEGPVMVVTGAILGPGEDVPLWPGITVEGLTFTHGEATAQEATPGTAYAGAGLTMHVSNATIRNCIITDNKSTLGGGYWYGGQGQPIIEDCQITNNEALSAGGGMFFANTPYPVRVRNCTIRGNTARYGGGIYAWNALVDFDYVLIAGNEATVQGAGAFFSAAPEGTILSNVTIAANKGGLGAAMRLESDVIDDVNTPSIPILERCILYANIGSRTISAQSLSGIEAGCTVIYDHVDNDVWSTVLVDRGGNMDADPKFCNIQDFTLQSDSPCLPGNHYQGEDCGLIGARGEGCSR